MHKRTANTVLFTLLMVILAGAVGWSSEDANKSEMSESKMTTTADHLTIPFETITGEKASLADFKGKVLLIVNTASKCGYTPQYEGLEALYEKYKDSGLVVIGFPANNFGGQEPGSNEEILEFCRTKFDVTFPMMAKVSVKGNDIHPLFKYLTEEAGHDGEIGWNFSKFLLDRNGKLVARFETKVKPSDSELVEKIEELL